MVLYLQCGILLASFLILFSHVLLKLLKDWSQNPNYSHGFLIPFITGYMIWEKRQDLFSIRFKPRNWGIMIIFAGMIAFILGNLGAELFTTRIAMIITIYGLSFYLMGTEITKKLTIPFAYLLFMVPIPYIVWNKIAFPLQLLTSRLAESVVYLFGIAILRDGNILYLENITLEVADACSGLRSLMTMLALSSAFSFLCKLSKMKKWILFISAIPIAIGVNVIRISLAALIAKYLGKHIVEGMTHQVSGLFIFLFGLVLLTVVYEFLSKVRKKVN